MSSSLILSQLSEPIAILICDLQAYPQQPGLLSWRKKTCGDYHANWQHDKASRGFCAVVTEHARYFWLLVKAVWALHHNIPLG